MLKQNTWQHLPCFPLPLSYVNPDFVQKAVSPLVVSVPVLLPGESKSLGLAKIGQELNLSHSAHAIPPATVLFRGWTCDSNWPSQIRENFYSMLASSSLSYFIWGWAEGSTHLPYCHPQSCKPKGSQPNAWRGAEENRFLLGAGA